MRMWMPEGASWVSHGPNYFKFSTWRVIHFIFSCGSSCLSEQLQNSYGGQYSSYWEATEDVKSRLWKLQKKIRMKGKLNWIICWDIVLGRRINKRMDSKSKKRNLNKFQFGPNELKEIVHITYNNVIIHCFQNYNFFKLDYFIIYWTPDHSRIVTT